MAVRTVEAHVGKARPAVQKFRHTVNRFLSPVIRQRFAVFSQMTALAVVR